MDDLRLQGCSIFTLTETLRLTPIARLCVFLIAVCSTVACAAGEGELPAGVTRITSKNFVLYSDLPTADAKARLLKLDQLIRTVSTYWGHRLRGKIDCYLVDDLNAWDGYEFETANARFVLRNISGGTDVKPAPTRRIAARSIIYASTDNGVAEHEAVHAYCFQTFGRGGPEWYREGMAQVFSHNALASGEDLHEWASTVGCIKQSRLSASQIMGERDVTRGLRRAVRSDAPESSGLGDLTEVRLRYARAWALCHLLSKHPSYQTRFRDFGRKLLTGAPVSFSRSFPGAKDEINFELAQFGEHYESGYDVKRCKWVWNQRFRQLESGCATTVRIRAGYGFQPTGVTVDLGEEYRIETRGEWRLGGDREPCNADGSEAGDGRLMAVVFKDFQLSQPVALGAQVSYRAKTPGELYFRCEDAWNQLSDNRGEISIRIVRRK